MFEESTPILEGGREIFTGWDWTGELNILSADDGETVIGTIKASAQFDADGLLTDYEPDLEDYQIDQLLELRDAEIGTRTGRDGE